MGKPCIAFSMENARDAWDHIRGNMEIIVNYGDEFEGKFLHTWDAGERKLCRCRLCGGYVLWQNSEFHGTMSDDSYYTNVFPVSGEEEAEELNRRWDGWEIEDEFPGKYLIQDDNKAPHWSRGEVETQDRKREECDGSASDDSVAKNEGKQPFIGKIHLGQSIKKGWHKKILPEVIRRGLFKKKRPGKTTTNKVIRQGFPMAKGLGEAAPDERYYKLQDRYKRFFEQFLIEQLFLDAVDQSLKKHELDFRPVKEKDQDYYQRTSGMGLTYIYLRNNLYIEKLTEAELHFLEEHSEYGTDVEQFVSETCERVVNPYDDVRMVFYGPESGHFLFSSDEIVLGIRYAEFDSELKDETFTKNFLQKQQIISRVSHLVTVLGLKKLEKKVSLIQYNEASIM